MNKIKQTILNEDITTFNLSYNNNIYDTSEYNYEYDIVHMEILIDSAKYDHYEIEEYNDKKPLRESIINLFKTVYGNKLSIYLENLTIGWGIGDNPRYYNSNLKLTYKNLKKIYYLIIYDKELNDLFYMKIRDILNILTFYSEYEYIYEMYNTEKYLENKYIDMYINKDNIEIINKEAKRYASNFLRI